MTLGIYTIKSILEDSWESIDDHIEASNQAYDIMEKSSLILVN